MTKRRLLLVPTGLAGALALGYVTLFGAAAGSASTSPKVANATATSTASGPSTAYPAPASTGSAASPTSSALSYGATLFDENCSSCHGVNAGGGALAPNLRGLGAGVVDLWVSSGWMPLATPTQQPIRKPAKFDRADTLAIAHYVASLASGGVAVPTPDLTNSSVAEGFSLFALSCAPCHTITGAGDALSNGLVAPPLHGLTTTQIEEAIATGPGAMPRLYPGAITKAQLLDLVAFVSSDIEKPANPGGLGLGGVGPVAEGFVGLFIGVGGCLLFAMWIGERSEEDEEGHDDHGGHEGHDAPHAEGAHV